MSVSKVPIKPGAKRTIKVRDSKGNIRTVTVKLVRKKGKK